jgi:hypothetical protein
MVTTKIIIDRMNDIARGEKRQVVGLIGEQPIRNDVIPQPTTHLPVQILPAPRAAREEETTDSSPINELVGKQATGADTMTQAATSQPAQAKTDTTEEHEESNHPTRIDAVRTAVDQEHRGGGARVSARIAAGIRRPEKYALHTSLCRGIAEYGQEAHRAIRNELEQLILVKKALVPVLRSELSAEQCKQIIRSSMFLKEKFDARGNFEKLKARLVADGRQQDRSLYPNTASPTVSVESIMMCLCIATNEKRKIAKMDVAGAYLNAPMNGENVYIELDKRLTDITTKCLPMDLPIENGKLTFKLDRALYGCVQSAKLWYEHLTGTLTSAGFVSNSLDPCVMNATKNGRQVTLLIYVDDILVTTEDEENIKWVEHLLRKAYGDIQVEIGPDISYLGMRIRMDDTRIELSMDNYVDSIIKEYGEVKPRSTPHSANLFRIDAAEELDEQQRKTFHTNVMRLLYLAQRLRQDILLPVLFLCTRVSQPTRVDEKKLDHVIGYLRSTRNVKKLIKSDSSTNLTAYIDASFATHHDGKSHSGCVITMGNTCINASSRKQKIVTKDSTEAEIVALQDMTTLVQKCHHFLEYQGIEPKIPLILQDNTSAITLVTTSGGKTRNKHLKARESWIRERIDRGEIKIQHIGTEHMLADALTKPNQGEMYHSFARRILGNTARVHLFLDRGALDKTQKASKAGSRNKSTSKTVI